MDRVVDASRRQAMALVGGSIIAGATALASVPAQAAGPHFDLSTQAGRARAYMMMRGALDDRLVMGCLTGRYYGVVDAAITPLFGVSAATLARYRPIAGGGHEAVTVEFAYFTDLATGAAIDRFRNPYTNETVDVPIVKSAPSRVRILPDLRLELDKPVPGLSLEHNVFTPEARGNDVWFTEVTRTTASRPGGAPFRYSESTTLHALRSDFDRSGAARVRCETSFTNVVGWRPWLKMGDRPGNLMAIGAGRYGVGVDEMPPSWLEATRRHHPALLANPAAALEPVWSAR